MKRILHTLLLLFVIGIGVISAQTKTIKGTITDTADGSPIPGATIMVKGTAIGTVTNFDGEYNLQVPEEGQTLVFSFVGMKTQEVAIAGRTVINVVLETESLGVEEVVVTAYGTKGKVGLKGAISVVEAKDMEQVPVASFDQMLQGKTTGLQISAGSGQPGSSNTTVRIRGNGSIMGGNDPLYVVDGVPIEAGAFAGLNANDFETVSVLKDASSTAIYGSRAANGVILITTKRGKEGKTNINVRHQSGVSLKTQEKFDMMNTAQKLWFEEIAQKGPGWEFSTLNPNYATLSADARQAQDDELARLRSINTDWQEYFFRMGKTNSTEVNFMGGSEKTQFYVSFQNYYQEGLAKRSDINRYTGRINLDHKVSDKIKFGLNASIGQSLGNRIENEGLVALTNPFAAVYLANPWEVAYSADGSFNTGNYLYSNPLLGDDQNSERYNTYTNVGSNALDQTEFASYIVEETKFVGAFNMEWNITPELAFKTQYGMDYRQTIMEREIRPEAYSVQVLGDDEAAKEGLRTQRFGRRLEATFTNTLDYKKLFADKHLFSAVIGSEYINRSSMGFGFTGYGLNPKIPGSLAGMTEGTAGNPDTGEYSNYLIPLVGGSESERALFSVFSLFNYTLSDKYTLSASLRRDASSAFGKDNKWATLYSIGLTWDVTREEFMQGLTWVNNLKFRVNYGLTGNQEGLDDYETLTTWGTSLYDGQNGTVLGRSGDKSLRWEIAKQFNVGFDYNLFANRLNGSLDVYNNITDDLFVLQTFSSWAGVPGNSKKTNAGSVRNRGVELLVNYDLIRKKNFTWTVGTNLSYNDNEVLDLGQVKEFEQGTSIIRVGLPLNSHYAVKWAGVNPANGNAMYYTKDGQITDNYSADDSVAEFGTSSAPFTGGFNTSISYKGIEIGALFNFAQGYKRYNNQTFFSENPNFAQYNMSTTMLDVWQNPGDITDVQGVHSARQFSSKDIEDSSFLRFRNLTVAYNLPQALLSRTGFVQKLRIYGQAQNLYTWTKWTGFDPDDSNNIAKFEYPTPRTFSVGIDLTF